MIAKIGPNENRTHVREVNLHHQKLYDGIPILVNFSTMHWNFAALNRSLAALNRNSLALNWNSAALNMIDEIM